MPRSGIQLDPAARVNLEIKQAEPPMVEALWQRIRELGVEDRVLVASEDHRLVQAFRRVAGGAVATSAGKLEIFAFWLGSRAGLSRWLPIDYDALQVPVRFAGLEVVNARFCKPLDDQGLGGTKHDAWTYWGHSGSPLFDDHGRIVALHNSWDSSTAMRHAVRHEAIVHFLAEHDVPHQVR